VIVVIGGRAGNTNNWRRGKSKYLRSEKQHDDGAQEPAVGKTTWPPQGGPVGHGAF
jgi:hypothetical protein